MMSYLRYLIAINPCSCVRKAIFIIVDHFRGSRPFETKSRIGVSAYRRIGVSAYRRIGVWAYRQVVDKRGIIG
jgi:hypothetical protein